MQLLDKIIAERNFGRPSAVKRGRNPQWPYVPIVDHGEQTTGVHRTRTEQIKAKAFAARENAISYAAAVIDARRIAFRRDLLEPGHRALREQYGLPAEIDMLLRAAPAHRPTTDPIRIAKIQRIEFLADDNARDDHPSFERLNQGAQS